MGSQIASAVIAGLLLASAVVVTATPYDASVARDGSGDYVSIAAALAAAPDNSDRPYRIFIAAGHYYEKLVVDKPNIQLTGAGTLSTRIHYDAYAGQSKPDGSGSWGTWGSATLTVRAANFHARDLHIENSFDYPFHDSLSAEDPRRIPGVQAVAVMTDHGSDRALFDQVRISGYQDTLFVLAGRSLFRNSVISGHVDFIFGAGTAVFVDTDIVVRPRTKPVDPIGYITAPSTDIDTPYGLVFINCRLLAEPGVPDDSVGLGRPWHPTTRFPDGRYADPNAIGQAVFIRCWMGTHIKEQGWFPMGGTARDGSRIQFQPQDARFFEFESHGPSANRNPDRRQLSPEQAASFDPVLILDGWYPARPATRAE